MSAGGSVAHVNRSFDVLAPKFAAAVVAGLEACNAAGLDAIPFETQRSDALAAIYYSRGRPPSAEFPTPVTNARDASLSWHGYGLAVDVISAKHEWSAGDEWFAKVAAIMKQHGLDWGGEWRSRDLPHFQWGKCKASPSSVSRALYAEGNIAEVWRLVGAE